MKLFFISLFSSHFNYFSRHLINIYSKNIKRSHWLWMWFIWTVVVVNLIVVQKNWFIFSKWFISFLVSFLGYEKMKVQSQDNWEWLFSLDFQLMSHMFRFTFVSKKLIIICEANQSWQCNSEFTAEATTTTLKKQRVNEEAYSHCLPCVKRT